MKKTFICFIVFAFLFAPFPGLAEDNVSVTINQVSGVDYFYPETFDNLLLDFMVSVNTADTLNTLVIKNEGSAKDVTEINKIILWSDNGNGQFDGFAFETELAEASYNYTYSVWVFNDLQIEIPVAGKRFYVTVETRKSGTTGKSFLFSIPAYDDVNSDGEYDNGDTGIFLSSEASVPTTKLENEKSTTYRGTLFDFYDPEVAVTNLIDGQALDSDTFVIHGQARDQGGSKVDGVQVCINSICEYAASTSAYSLTWEYEWTDIADGTYEVTVKAADFNKNTVITEAISVTKKTPQVVSITTSSASFTKLTAVADAVDAVGIDVVVKDASGLPIEGKTVYFSELADGTAWVVDSEKITDAEGKVDFQVRSNDAGVFNVSVMVEGGYYLVSDQEITYTAVVTETPATETNYLDGQWVKLADQTAVYFLDSNNVRHAYPTLGVWQTYFEDDFSFVETITAEVMGTYNLGDNVPFKAGSLIKTASISKVYKVEDGRIIRWVKSEASAAVLGGAEWSSQVKLLPESFFSNYTAGEDIE